MPDASTLAVFVVAALALLVVPGPAVLYIVARGIDQGRRAGLVSALGVQVGSLVHVAAATLGLSALLVSSAVAFSLVKYAGAAYLIVLGVRTLARREASRPVAAPAPAPAPLARVFAQGVLVNVLNPKTALFFFAFLPQFVDPARGAVAGQTLLFGCLLVALGVVSDGLYAVLAGSVGGWLKGNARFLRRQRYVVGGVYIGLGVTTALADTRKR
jgi:threonine/homoserine/homoserine lactone efflux protein